MFTSCYLIVVMCSLLLYNVENENKETPSVAAFTGHIYNGVCPGRSLVSFQCQCSAWQCPMYTHSHTHVDSVADPPTDMFMGRGEKKIQIF